MKIMSANMKRLIKDGDAEKGALIFDLNKFFTNFGSLVIGIFSILYFQDKSAILAGNLIALITLYVAIVGYHRLIIHRSFTSPLWVEYLLVYVGSLCGMGTPLQQIHNHDMRDWAQRKRACHNYFNHQNSLIKDGIYQMFYRIELDNPPEFRIEEGKKLFYKLMENFWLLNQLPFGILLYLAGGWSWVGTGVFLKIFSVRFGHWLVAYFLHHYGQKPIENTEAGVQGYNIPCIAWVTFGESYHNNHHLYPDAAKNSFRQNETDLAWGLIWLLKKVRLITNEKIYSL